MLRALKKKLELANKMAESTSGGNENATGNDSDGQGSG